MCPYKKENHTFVIEIESLSFQGIILSKKYYQGNPFWKNTDLKPTMTMQHSTQRKLVRLISYNILYLDLNVKDKGTYILYLNEHIVLHFYFQANNTKRFLSETMQKCIVILLICITNL